jgi:hypothetical protein
MAACFSQEIFICLFLHHHARTRPLDCWKLVENKSGMRINSLAMEAITTYYITNKFT